MSHTPHELTEEFPEAVELIQRLKTEDAHFARLAETYHELNRTIHRVENRIEARSEFEEEDLRKQRLALKDEIAILLRSAA